MSERINADNFTMRDVAKYLDKGYTLRLTEQGWVMFKLEVIGGTDVENQLSGAA